MQKPIQTSNTVHRKPHLDILSVVKTQHPISTLHFHKKFLATNMSMRCLTGARLARGIGLGCVWNNCTLQLQLKAWGYTSKCAE